MKPGELHYHVGTDGSVATITVDNAARYNAVSLAMWENMVRYVAQANNDPSVRVIVLRGAGEKAFVSGADISEFATLRDSPEQVERYNNAVDAAQSALIESPKPVIAVIRGICMGGGIGLALSCDLRFCSHTSRFRMPAARLGLGYDRKGLQRAVSVLGAARTTDIFMTARTFDGIEAQRIGMVHDSFADDEFDAQTNSRVEQVAQNAPLTLKAAKLAIRSAINDPQITDPGVVDAAVQACFDSNDYREGRAAFGEKRLPRFTGR
jgi:enoyl-CoA hydratase/carnithine racemase